MINVKKIKQLEEFYALSLYGKEGEVCPACGTEVSKVASTTFIPAALVTDNQVFDISTMEVHCPKCAYNMIFRPLYSDKNMSKINVLLLEAKS